MSKSNSLYEKLFDLDDDLLEKKRQEFLHAEATLTASQVALQRAQDTLRKCSIASETTGKPRVPYKEVANANVQLKGRQKTYRVHQTNLAAIQSRLGYLRARQKLRDLLNWQPWYVFSTVAGAVGFVLFILLSVLFRNEIWSHFAIALTGFAFGFVFLAVCVLAVNQSVPDNYTLAQSISQAVLLETEAAFQCHAASEQMHVAGAVYSRLFETHQLKAALNEARAVVADCEEDVRDASFDHERLRTEYQKARDALRSRETIASTAIDAAESGNSNPRETARG